MAKNGGMIVKGQIGMPLVPTDRRCRRHHHLGTGSVPLPHSLVRLLLILSRNKATLSTNRVGRRTQLFLCRLHLRSPPYRFGRTEFGLLVVHCRRR